MKFLVKSIIIFWPLLMFQSCQDNPTSSTTYIINNLSGDVYNLPLNAKTYSGALTDGINPDFIFGGHFQNERHIEHELLNQSWYDLKDVDEYVPAASNIVISDHDAKLNDLKLYACDSTSLNILGKIIKDNHSGVSNTVFEGFFVTSVIYCDRSLQLGGNHTTIYNGDTTVMRYNANFGEGWNLVTIKVTKLRSFYIEHEFYTGESNGGQWYFYPK